MLLTVLVVISLILGVRVLLSFILVCVESHNKKENKTFDELKYKDHKEDIVNAIDVFYQDGKKVDGLLKNKKLLFRKAQLTNLLTERKALSDTSINLVISLSCTVASCVLEGKSIEDIIENGNLKAWLEGIVIGMVIVGALLYVIIQKGMEDVETEAYRYELEYITRAVESHIGTSLVAERKSGSKVASTTTLPRTSVNSY